MVLPPDFLFQVRSMRGLTLHRLLLRSSHSTHPGALTSWQLQASQLLTEYVGKCDTNAPVTKLVPPAELGDKFHEVRML